MNATQRHTTATTLENGHWQDPGDLLIARTMVGTRTISTIALVSGSPNTPIEYETAVLVNDAIVTSARTTCVGEAEAKHAVFVKWAREGGGKSTP